MATCSLFCPRDEYFILIFRRHHCFEFCRVIPCSITRIKTGQFQAAVLVQMFQSWLRLRLNKEFKLTFHPTSCQYHFNPFLIVFCRLFSHSHPTSSATDVLENPFRPIEMHKIYFEASKAEKQVSHVPGHFLSLTTRFLKQTSVMVCA